MQTILEKVGIAVVLLFFVPQAAFLMADSLLLRCMDAGSVHTFFLRGNPLLSVALFALLAVIAAVFVHRKNTHPAKSVQKEKPLTAAKILCAAAALVLAAALVWFVMGTRFHARDDQGVMLEIARELLDGDLSSLQPGGYLALHHHQKGLLLYFVPLVALLGGAAELGIQLLNVFWLLLGVWALADAASRCLNGRWEQYFLPLLAFLPMALYVTFVYGNLVGMAMQALALDALARFNQKGKLFDAAAAALCTAVGSCIKGNYIIFTIAIGLYFLWYFLKNGGKTALLGLLLCGGLLMGLRQGVTWMLYPANGLAEPEGYAITRWVGIGLHAEPGQLEGWYVNFPIGNYEYADPAQLQAANEVTVDEVKNSLRDFAANPAKALRFFSRKEISQWNMADFHSLFVNRNRRTEQNLHPLVVSLLHEGGKLFNLYQQYCSLFLAQIWLGVSVWLLLNRRRLHLEQLIFAVIFVGGFLFELAWEARAQYTAPFVMVLIPYAVQGIWQLGERLEQLVCRKKLPRPAAFVFAVLGCLPLLGMSITGNYLAVTAQECAEEQQGYAAYLQAAVPVLPDGPYTLEGNDGVVQLPLYKKGSRAVLKKKDATPFMVIYSSHSVTSDFHYYQIVTMETDPLVDTRAVGVSSFEGKHFVNLKEEVSAAALSQQWIFTPAENGMFYVLDSDGLIGPAGRALTCNAKTGVIEMLPFTGESNQQWRFVPAKTAP